MNSVRTVLKNPFVCNALRRAYHDTGSFKPATMNDMPVPSGPWKAKYDKNQTKYNMHLLMGIAFTTLTLITAKASGLVYLNYSPPSSLN